MKKELLMVCAIFLVACGEPVSVEDGENKTNSVVNIVTRNTSSPYIKLYNSDCGILANMSLTECKLDNVCMHGFYQRYMEPNTLYLDKENTIGLCITNSFKMDTTDATQTKFHLHRDVEVVKNDKNNTPQHKFPRLRKELSCDFHITIQPSLPIEIINPHSLEGQIIPFCYYDEMVVEWNPDYGNTNGVVVIVEWDGVTLQGPDTQTFITGVDIVDDTGSTTLNNHLFDGIPDGALVTLHLLRGNIVQLVNDGNNLNLSELQELALSDPNLLENYLQENQDLIAQLQNVAFVDGARAYFTMYLVRNL